MDKRGKGEKPIDVSDIVLGVRLRSHLSRQELAEKVGMDKKKIRNLELGIIGLPDLPTNEAKALKDELIRLNRERREET